VRQLMQVTREPFWEVGNVGTLAMLSLVRGKLADAGTYARRAVAVNEQRGVPGSELHVAVAAALIDLRYRNAPEAARRRVDEAVRRHPWSALPVEDRPYLDLAWFYAEAGRADRARQLLAEYEATVPEPTRRGQPFRYGAAAALAIAEGRVRDGINGYRAWYDGGDCTACGLFELARAYERAREPDSALAVYEQRGQLDKARDYYGRFVDLWRNADPELQPLVRDVKQRLARLTAEGAR